MGTYKKGHNYWNEKQEDLVLAWTTATTQSEYTRIHNALRPALNFMSELILNRYFSCPFARQNEIKADAVQHCFLLMNKYHPSKVKNTNGAYSFCSMVIKHYYMDELVNSKDLVKVIYNKLDYYDELPPESKPIDYGENVELPREMILSHFNELLKKERYLLVQEKKKYLRSKRVPRTRKMENNIAILKLAIEFVEKFNSFDAAALADYIYLNQNEKLNLKKTTIVYYFRKHFKVDVVVNANSKDDKNKVNSKYNYLQDDFVPIDFKKKWRVRNARIRLKERKEYEYF